MSITKTLTGLSKSSGGRPISDTEMLKWANTTAQRAKPSVRPIRSFKDPAISTGLFFLDLLDAIRPGIVDPALVEAVSENGDPELKKQNGEWFCRTKLSCWKKFTLFLLIAKLAISIARKMNALIFLVPEDIVDVRPRLVRPILYPYTYQALKLHFDRSWHSWVAWWALLSELISSAMSCHERAVLKRSECTIIAIYTL